MKNLLCWHDTDDTYELYVRVLIIYSQKYMYFLSAWELELELELEQL